MLQRIKNLILSLAMLLLPAAPLGVSVALMAQSPPIQANLCEGADTLQITPSGDTTCVVATATCDFNCTLRKTINIISVIVGVIAVIMIIFGGFRYITSGGQPEKVTGAKNTILYGIVGLIIVAVAQIIVRFVLREVTTASTTP